MNHSLIVKSALVLIILTIDVVVSSPVRADIGETMLQNQKQLEQQSNDLRKELSSQKLWENFRQQQDEQIIKRQQQQSEQFRQQNELRQQQPFGQSRQQNQLRQQPFDQFRQDQQRQQLEIFRLQQKLRQQQ